MPATHRIRENLRHVRPVRLSPLHRPALRVRFRAPRAVVDRLHLLDLLAHRSGRPPTRRALVLLVTRAPQLARRSRRPRLARILDAPGEVSEWLKVPLSKSGVVYSHRGFESHPLRHFQIRPKT